MCNTLALRGYQTGLFERHGLCHSGHRSPCPSVSAGLLERDPQSIDGWRICSGVMSWKVGFTGGDEALGEEAIVHRGTTGT